MKRLLLVLCIFPTLPLQAADFDVPELLASHNHWRATVGVPPLTYSTELAASSQRWANQLKQTNQCKMKHSQSNGAYGENLYWASAVLWSDGKHELQKVFASKVVADWASERTDYDYQLNTCTPGKMCGHYTQVVWHSTTAVGCAIAICENTKEQVWVCQYQPAGNWVGEKPY
ncbi:MAG: CAP domain-containing protein [Pseudomonadota bacterium]